MIEDFISTNPVRLIVHSVVKQYIWYSDSLNYLSEEVSASLSNKLRFWNAVLVDQTQVDIDESSLFKKRHEAFDYISKSQLNRELHLRDEYENKYRYFSEYTDYPG